MNDLIKFFLALSLLLTNSWPVYAKEDRYKRSRLSLIEELSTTWNKTRTYRELVKKFTRNSADEAYLIKYLKEKSLLDRHPDPMFFDMDTGTLELKIGNSKALINILSFYPLKALYNNTPVQFSEKDPLEERIKKFENQVKKNPTQASLKKTILRHLLPSAEAQTQAPTFNPSSFPTRTALDQFLAQQKTFGMTEAQAQQNINTWEASQPTPWTNIAIVGGSVLALMGSIWLGLEYWGDKKEEPKETPVPTEEEVKKKSDELIKYVKKYKEDLHIDFNCEEPRVAVNYLDKDKIGVIQPGDIMKGKIQTTAEECCKDKDCKAEVPEIMGKSSTDTPAAEPAAASAPAPATHSTPTVEAPTNSEEQKKQKASSTIRRTSKGRKKTKTKK